MRKLYAGFVQADVEQPFVYRLSEEQIKQKFPDGTIETENFLLVTDGHYTKIFGTSGAPLDTPFVYDQNIMVYCHKNRQKTPYEIFDSIGDECRHFLKAFCI